MELAGTNQDAPSSAFPMLPSNTAQSTPTQMGQAIAHSVTALVLAFTALWREQGKWKARGVDIESRTNSLHGIPVL